MSEPHRTHENNKSSLFEKLPPDLRRAVDIAIIERHPPTFRAVWMELQLGRFGVSFTAFYRYARRLRDRVNLAEAAGLAAENDPGIDDAIQKLVSRQLLELLLNTHGPESTKEITALMSAHRQAAKTDLHDRRLTEQSRLAWARLEHDREHLRLKSEFLQSARDGVLTLLDEANKRRSSAVNHVNPVNPVHLDEAKKRRRPTLDDNSPDLGATGDQPDHDSAPRNLPVVSSP